jgi:hypothetical protein
MSNGKDKTETNPPPALHSTQNGKDKTGNKPSASESIQSEKTTEKPDKLMDLIIKNIKDKDLQVINPTFISIILVGLIIKLTFGVNVSSADGSTGPASSLIWGYMIIIFGIIGIIYSNLNPALNDYDAIKNLPYPIIITIVLMFWLISMNIGYFKEINSISVPEQYYTWSNYSTLLLLFLLCVSIFQYMLDKIKKKNQIYKEYANNLTIYSWILVTLNLAVIIIQQVILNSFTVDG